MRDLLTTVLVIGRSTTRFWLLDDLLHPLAASWRKQRPARNPPNTMKLEAGSKLQIPLPISWCRAGVSASIEDRHGQGRATASSAALRRQTRAYSGLRGNICDIDAPRAGPAP